MKTETEIRKRIAEIEGTFEKINSELSPNSKEGMLLATIPKMSEFVAGILASTGELEILKWVLGEDSK